MQEPAYPVARPVRGDDDRFTYGLALDVAAVPVLRSRTHLPVIVDPSHAAGDRSIVTPLALAGQAAGAHGIMVEIHPTPETALSDGPQSLRLDQFQDLMRALGFGG